MITDWKQEIATAWLVKQAMMELDMKKIYPYHLPEVAATDEQLLGAEKSLGFALDPRYRTFLSFANGWKGFLQKTDLFGTGDLIQGPMHDTAQFILSYIDDDILRSSGIRRCDLLPIAASASDRDLCVMLRPQSVKAGMIFWFGGEEIDHFTTFDDFFLEMVNYNRLEVQRFRETKRPQ